MKKTTILLVSGLLISSPALADRPAVSEHRPAASASPAPVAQPAPAPSAVELEMQQQKEVQVQTGDAIELQPGETLSVRVLDFPRRGMSMDKVQNELGSPIEISPTVGEPPITSWTYEDRVVYFEYSTVLHVVATR